MSSGHYFHLLLIARNEWEIRHLTELLLAAPHPKAYDSLMQNLRSKLDELPGGGFERDRAARVLRVMLGLAWDVVRLPALTLLAILEPLVAFVFSACALLLAITALFFKFLVHRRDFPFWGMLALAIGCVWALALYYMIIRVLGLRAAVARHEP